MADRQRMTPNGPDPAEPSGSGPSAHRAGEPLPFDDPLDAHGDGLDDHERRCLEWCPICRSADVLRATATPEMREQWQGIQRDALIAVRALLDSYIDRLESERRAAATDVEDIPIE